MYILCLVVVGLLFLILAQQDHDYFIYYNPGEQDSVYTDEVCSDEKPEESPFSCYRYVRLGLCDGIAEQFCRKSCERCDCSEAQALFCDVQGLIALKNSFKKGQEYLKSWRGDNPCHEWEFIACNQTINRVRKITLDLTNTIIEDAMSGSLVPELSKLRYLQILSFWSVHLNGELPLEYSMLNKLRQFSLYDTIGVNGTLPMQYKSWSQIKLVAIQGNQITGTIPIEFSSWTSIKALYLNENLFSAKIPPSFSTWKQLLLITLSNNNLTGTLSIEFSKWNQVSFLNVLSNKLTGSLPKEYSTLSRMNFFSVADNKLSGNLPVEYSKWAVCELFSVAVNFLSGTLPVEYSEMKPMKVFHVGSNYFRGWLPKEYSTMIRLENFTSFNNYLNKYIPKEWSKLQEQAKQFRVQNNKLSIQQKYLNPQQYLSP